MLLMLLISYGNSKIAAVHQKTIAQATVAQTTATFMPTARATAPIASATVMPTKAPVITPTATIVTANKNFTNSIVAMDTQDYAEKITATIDVADFYDAQIGSTLKKCEIGIAKTNGYDIKIRNNLHTCLILFVPAIVAAHVEQFSGMRLTNNDSAFTVAMTTFIDKPSYPVIFVSDGKFDLFYLARVLVHEGSHMMHLRNATVCVKTSTCEEAQAYEVQFKMLESMYSQDTIALGDKYYALDGSQYIPRKSLEFEYMLYQKWQAGNLETFLSEINY